MVSIEYDVDSGQPLRKMQHSAKHVSLLGESGRAEWAVLGPFQIGTREFVWGADPLEHRNSFRSLSLDKSDAFRSALAPGGYVTWSDISPRISRDKPSSLQKVGLTVGFSHIDWSFMQSVYGWAGLQWQCWTRGIIRVSGALPRRFVLDVTNAVEFWIDDCHYFGGDLYGFKRATPVIVLEPGDHQLDIRLYRDNRAQGAANPPSIDVSLEIREVGPGLSFVRTNVLISDVIDGNLAAPFASVDVRNNGDEIMEIRRMYANSCFDVSTVLSREHLSIWPGQTRPVAFTITVNNPTVDKITIFIDYCEKESKKTVRTIELTQKLSNEVSGAPHKFTFLHPSGIVSYAILRPPKLEMCSNEDGPFPVLIGLHGAGVDADSPEAIHALDGLEQFPAWVISPSGVTSWCGDDWHQWAAAEVDAAVKSIPDWINFTKWKGPGVNVDDWVVIGHSNGGQGVYYLLTHRSDKVIAVAQSSGYLSIQKYVPFQMWHEADPAATAVVQSALNNYKHELLVKGISEVPIHFQHGSVDDNVPAYHSRRMFQLLDEQAQPTDSTYTEIPGQNHWFDGIMTTPNMMQFYAKHLTDKPQVRKLPQSFALVVANPAATSSRHGVEILQLHEPSQIGKIEVFLGSEDVKMTTSNVRRFAVDLVSLKRPFLEVDCQKVLANDRGVANEPVHFLQTRSGSWKVSDEYAEFERRRSQVGPMDAILRSSSRFLIGSEHSTVAPFARQISRNLLQYFGADSELTASMSETMSYPGIRIVLHVGWSSLKDTVKDFPIQIHPDGFLLVRRHHERTSKYTADQESLGAVFLQPRPQGLLDLVVWGADESGLAIAARLIPTVTGGGQPDFVIVTRRCLWEGVGGVLGLGYFDYEWSMAKSSYFA